MQAIGARFKFLFQRRRADPRRYRSARVVTAIWGMLSGPMAELGVREVVVKASGSIWIPSSAKAASSSCIIRSRWR